MISFIATDEQGMADDVTMSKMSTVAKPYMLDGEEPFSRRMSSSSKVFSPEANQGSSDNRAKNFIMKIVERKQTIKKDTKPSQGSFYRKTEDATSDIAEED